MITDATTLTALASGADKLVIRDAKGDIFTIQHSRILIAGFFGPQDIHTITFPVEVLTTHRDARPRILAEAENIARTMSTDYFTSDVPTAGRAAREVADRIRQAGGR